MLGGSGRRDRYTKPKFSQLALSADPRADGTDRAREGRSGGRPRQEGS